MKALQVEEYLGREAIRNVMNKESSFKFVSGQGLGGNNAVLANATIAGGK
jgi:hypothetical protein